MKTVRICEVAEQVRGVTFSKGDATSNPRHGYIPVLTASNIQDGRLVTSDLTYVPASKIKDKQRVRANDVVVCTSSGSLGVVGKAARSRGDFSGGFGAFLKVLRPGPEVDPAYFAHFFQTPEYRRKVSQLAAGANINNLRNEHLDDLVVYMPPLPEQRRIAAILDHAHSLRDKRSQVLVHLDALGQSVFHAMFGDPVTDERWPVRLVGEIAAPSRYAIVDGPFGSALKPHDYVSSGIPVIRIKNVSKTGELDTGDLLYIERSKFESLRRSALSPGDILVSRVGTLGNTCVFPHGIGDALLSTTGVCKISVDTARFHPRFVHSALRTPQFQRQIERSASTSVQKYFNLSALKSWRIIEPPIDIQLEFVAVLNSLEERRRTARRALAAADALFASLQSRAFRGEL